MQAAHYWATFLAIGIVVAAGIHLLRRFLIAPPEVQPSRALLPDIQALSANYRPKSFVQAALSARFIPDQDVSDFPERDPIHYAKNAIEHSRPEETDVPTTHHPAPKPARLADAIPSHHPDQRMMRSTAITSPTPFTEALKVQAGRLVENIPRHMKVGKLQPIEVRLADQLNPAVLFGLKGQGDVHVHALPVVETMSVELFCPTQAFAIERCSEPAQLVQKAVLANSLLSNPDVPFAQWQWTVMPLRAGNHELTLRVSARIADSRGQPTTHTLVPDRDITVHVKVNSGRLFRSILLWLAGGLAAAFLGAVIQDQVWPLIREAIFQR